MKLHIKIDFENNSINLRYYDNLDTQWKSFFLLNNNSKCDYKPL